MADEPGLAPMEGVTEFPARLWFGLTSAPAEMTTPFLRITSTSPGRSLPRDYAPELFRLRGALPWRLIPQVMAADAAHAARVLPLLPEGIPLSINAGCPSNVVTGKGAGSGLLRDAARFAGFLTRLVDAAGPGRISIKMRTGWAAHEELNELLDGIAGLPLHSIVIHGRTRAGRYSRGCRWDLIRQAAIRLDQPVIGSGDILSRHHLHRLLPPDSPVAGAIIGRGALRHPWIFDSIRTGRDSSIPAAALIHSLGCWVLLHLLWLQDRPGLYDLVERGLFTFPCGNRPERWEALYRDLAGHCGTAADPADLQTPAKVTGRLKLLWTYLRSSLPANLQDRQLLRQKSAGGLLTAVRSRTAPAQNLPLRHHEELDVWYESRQDARAPQPAKETSYG